jgi:N-acetylglutamate synthase/N-acetylornithine aminotransferase
MKVIVNNLLNAPQFVDVDGNASTDDTVIIGGRQRTEITLPSKKRFLDLQAEFKGKLTFRAV